MEAHNFGYVAASYGVAFVVLVALIGGLLLQRRARLKELARLEASGIKRRSDG
jgi:heme exporter protein CcmD